MSKVLVVDDEEKNLKLAEALLLPQGYEVNLASNGEEALASVKKNPPDVILLDIMMPGMDGFETCRRLKEDEVTKTVPLVMVTSLKDVEDRVKALDAGADDFLSKPVDKSELRARISSLIKVKAYNDHMKNYQKELEDTVAERTSQLRESLAQKKAASYETILRLSRAAEYKDDDTGAHVMRMSHYAESVARKLNLSNAAAELLLNAAPMHDIGKIGTPDSILLKPGKLDPDEWVIMKEHALNGKKILEGSDAPVIRLAEVVAHTHHEKWDGSGYPRGLRGEDIPIVGRIVAIADVFDALTSKRPYKKPFSIEKSFTIIRENRGFHFDPAVVDAFFAIENDILAIKEKYQDQGESLLFRKAGSSSQLKKEKEGSFEHELQFAAWREEYGVGNDLLDTQHKTILNTVNTLYNTVKQGGTRKALGAILEKMLEYTKVHFQAEEKVMKDVKYPGYEQQVRAHNDITQQVKMYSEKLHRESIDVSLEVLEFLKEWWVNHILIMDQQYAPYLKKKLF